MSDLRERLSKSISGCESAGRGNTFIQLSVDEMRTILAELERQGERSRRVSYEVDPETGTSTRRITESKH